MSLVCFVTQVLSTLTITLAKSETAETYKPGVIEAPGPRLTSLPPFCGVAAKMRPAQCTYSSYGNYSKVGLHCLTQPPLFWRSYMRIFLRLTSSSPFVKINLLGWHTRGDEKVLHLGASWVPAGAPPRKRGLHPL